MDGHFDFNDFHPTFLSNEGWSGLGGFGDFFQPHMNDFLQQAHEFDLPADVIHNALESACKFIGIPDMDFAEAPATAVSLGDTTTYADDKLLFGRDQLLNSGIHDEDSLSLICTHEAAHRVFQYVSSTHQLSTWQNELACDAFMGVRSVAEHMDIEPIKDFLRPYHDCPSHPGFELRNEYLEIGRQIGQYLLDHDLPINMQNILNELRPYIDRDANSILTTENRINQLANMDINQSNIAAFTKEDVDYYAHQVRISSGSEKEHWLERYNWALNHLTGITSMPDSLTPEEWLKKSGYGESGHVLDGPNGQA